MIITTSLSLKHSNSQHEAINSWQYFGKRYSLNSANEINISEYQNIEFIETHKTIQHLTGKPLVTINAMIDLAIQKEDDLLIVNSDIIIKSLPTFKENGITIFNRYDYTNFFDDGKIFKLGFDMIYIPKSLLSIFPPSIYAMGATWWDYWIPFFAIKKNIPIYSSHVKHIFHKVHPIQYSHDEWKYLGEYFRLDFKLEKNLNMEVIAPRTVKIIHSKISYGND